MSKISTPEKPVVLLTVGPLRRILLIPGIISEAADNVSYANCVKCKKPITTASNYISDRTMPLPPDSGRIKINNYCLNCAIKVLPNIKLQLKYFGSVECP